MIRWFVTDLTPSTFNATCAALSRRAAVSAVPYSVTAPFTASTSIDSAWRPGSVLRADVTLVRNAASAVLLPAAAVFALLTPAA